jgi:hypothetical protein
MPVERRGQVTDVGIDRSTGNGRNRLVLAEGGSLRFGGTSRMNREVHVRICKRLGVKFPGATWPLITSCMDERDECKRTAEDASKFVRWHRNRGVSLPWEAHGGNLRTGHVVSGVQAA